jgi:hypothetical protein
LLWGQSLAQHTVGDKPFAATYNIQISDAIRRFINTVSAFSEYHEKLGLRGQRARAFKGRPPAAASSITAHPSAKLNRNDRKQAESNPECILANQVRLVFINTRK